MENSVVIDYMTAFIDQIFRLFTSWEIPFIGLTPAYFLGALMILGIVSFCLRTVIGMAGGISLGGHHLYKESIRRMKKHQQQKTAKR